MKLNEKEHGLVKRINWVDNVGVCADGDQLTNIVKACRHFILSKQYYTTKTWRKINQLKERN